MRSLACFGLLVMAGCALTEPQINLWVGRPEKEVLDLNPRILLEHTRKEDGLKVRWHSIYGYFVCKDGMVAELFQSQSHDDPQRLKALQAATSWDKKTMDAIASKKVFVGMTALQLRFSWGDPQKVSDSISGSGKIEHWEYGAWRGQYTRWLHTTQSVMLENGKVFRIDSY